MGFDHFQQMSFQNRNCAINYWYKKGTGNEWVILLHGAGCDHLMFEKQIELFEEKYTVIAWDARGHGSSKLDNGWKFNFKDMYSDLIILFEMHKIKKAVLIGQSMGGNLSQEIAYYRPDFISKCVLIDCTKNTQRLTVIEKISLKISRFIFRFYPWKTLVRQSANACGKTEPTKQYVIQCFEKMKKENFIEIMMSLFLCLHEDNDFRFSQPVLLMCGKEDITGNIKKIMQSWPKNNNNCRLYMVENAGHNANQDNPDAVNKEIKLFLRD
jgi:pimeloyl-ACP methyl ester carboxylesterase